MTAMTKEELQAKLAVKFPKIDKAKAQVKDYLTLRLNDPGELVPIVAYLKSELGFDYLDMVTAVDWKGPIDMNGFIRDPNPNVFLPEGATPEIDAPTPTAGVDYREAIEIVYCLSNLNAKIKVCLKADLPRRDPRVPSLVTLFRAADWQEREVYDLLGVAFEGHPNLSKILTPDFIQGHPLRKDYVHVKDRFD